ncbi:MAG: hypothetical protein V4858_18715 [Pseudomonadota bacterium]
MRDAPIPSSLSALTVLAVICASLLSACATPPRIAQKKTIEVAGQKLEFGGAYDARHTALTLSINADPVMSGRFPPYTPTLRLSSQYQGMDVSANCYFGSVLGSKPGVLGIVSGAVQAGHGKSGDKCDVLVGGKVVEALYF